MCCSFAFMLPISTPPKLKFILYWEKNQLIYFKIVLSHFQVVSFDFGNLIFHFSFFKNYLSFFYKGIWFKSEFSSIYSGICCCDWFVGWLNCFCFLFSIFFVAVAMIVFGRVIFNIEDSPAWLRSYNCSSIRSNNVTTSTSTSTSTSAMMNAMTQRWTKQTHAF